MRTNIIGFEASRLCFLLSCCSCWLWCERAAAFTATASAVKSGAIRIQCLAPRGLRKLRLSKESSTSAVRQVSSLHLDRVIQAFSSEYSYESTKLWILPEVLSILKDWRTNYTEDTWSSIFNKRNLKSELEESIVALQFFMEWLGARKESDPPVCLVDTCCGKGLTALLASHLFQGDDRIKSILMMDKNESVDWSYVKIANQRGKQEGGPSIIMWQGANLFETDATMRWIKERGSQTSSESLQFALMGIHLCKNLSPAFLGLANVMGYDRVPFLCLAPCCLPRIVVQQSRASKDPGRRKFLNISQYESPLQRQARLEAQRRRNLAKRRQPIPCLLCQSTEHRLHKCPQFAQLTMNDQNDAIAKAKALEPCWKCGELGHIKQDCPNSQQTTSVPQLIPRPILSLDVTNVIQQQDPFEHYCHLLGTSIQRKRVRVVNTNDWIASSNSHPSVGQDGKNWNGKRKTTYIIASNA